MPRDFTSLLLPLAMAVCCLLAPSMVYADDCVSHCAGLGEDLDGDGLDDCQEACLGTLDTEADTDGDGMPDNFENAYGLKPLFDDSSENVDGDDLTNLEEFLESSDPTDAASPYAAHYVAMDGDDANGVGSYESPWRTIGFALTQLSPASYHDIGCIILRAGVYYEDITLDSWISLVGERGHSVSIVGQIAGAPGARLKNLTLSPAAGQQYMLDLNDADMHLKDVVFSGSAARDVTGILMDGEAAGDSLIESCTFTSLGVGIDIGGGVPTVRRSTFGDIPAAFGNPERAGAGIIIRSRATSSSAQIKAIGDETDPEDGWNDFLSSIEGFAVINERDEAVPMQANYWGTVDPAVFPTRVSGAAVVLPVLVQRSAVLASSIFCTIWDAGDQKRIDTASVTLAISSFGTVSEGTHGTYAFPAVSEGAYTLTVNAPGYAPRSMEMTLGSGELKSLSFAMELASPGYGSVNEDFSKGCALTAGGSAQGDQRAQGDVVLMAMALAAFLVRGRAGQRGSTPAQRRN